MCLLRMSECMNELPKHSHTHTRMHTHTHTHEHITFINKYTHVCAHTYIP